MMPDDRIQSFYKDHCVYLPAMLGWFFFSALLSTYNKVVFGSGQMGFPCPLLLTSIHFLIQWGVSHLACAIFPVSLGVERVNRMSWSEWASISVPCGLVTALDVGLSNLSLVTITITFYTMVKSSTPIFVLGWAYAFGIERITSRLVGVIMVIAAGEFLTVMGEVDFVVHGFLLCLSASVLSGARWTLVQSKLQNLNPPLKTTIATMKLLSPSMFILMLFMSLTVERPWTKFSAYQESGNGIWGLLLLGAIGGFLAISMVLCEFYLILHSSAMILMIGGVIKEMTTIVIGVTFFGDKLNLVNMSGCLVVFSGVILYKVVFHLEKAEKGESMHVKVDKKEENGGKLIENESGFRDEVDEASSLSYPRAVELVGRHSAGGYSPKTSHQMMQDRVDPMHMNDVEETEYVLPSLT